MVHGGGLELLASYALTPFDNMSVDTLSTANNKSDIIIPTDSKDQIISDESNPAYLAGALHEAKEFYERTGRFENLIKYRAVLHSNKITVASEVSAFFVSGQITLPKSYTFDDPCESDPDRVTAYDVGARPSVSTTSARRSLA